MVNGRLRYRRRHDRDAPRSWFSLFVRLGGWVCLGAAAALLVATFASAISLRVAERLDAEAGYAQAVITGKSVLGSWGEPESWRVSFTYKTESGGRTAEVEVPEAFYNEVSVGSEYPVRYLRADPGVVDLQPRQSRTAGNVLRFIALGLGILGLVTLWRFGTQTNAAILARRDGQKRMATVIAVRDTGVRINGRAQGRLVWREEGGETGESLMRDRGQLEHLYKPGDPVVVFRRDRDVFWEGDVGPPRREMVR